MSDNPPFPWKYEVLRGLIATVTGWVATTVLNAVYRMRFPELGSFIDSLSFPLLFSLIGIFIVLSFVLRMARLKQRSMRILTDCMLIAGLIGLSIAVVAALNTGAVPLKSFDLTGKNIYNPREVPIPQALESVTLKVSGDRDPGFPLELERRSPGNGDIEQLEIKKLEAVDIRQSRYYTLVRGKYTVPGPFQAGDTLYLHIANASSFEGRIKLVLTGSKDQGVTK
jgi:hypothetical protein